MSHFNSVLCLFHRKKTHYCFVPRLFGVDFARKQNWKCCWFMDLRYNHRPGAFLILLFFISSPFFFRFLYYSGEGKISCCNQTIKGSRSWYLSNTVDQVLSIWWTRLSHKSITWLRRFSGSLYIFFGTIEYRTLVYLCLFKICVQVVWRNAEGTISVWNNSYKSVFTLVEGKGKRTYAVSSF